MSNIQTTPKPIDRDKQAVACLTVRDIFAAHAMNGIVTSTVSFFLADGTHVKNPQHFAALSYEIADAMLKERAK